MSGLAVERGIDVRAIADWLSARNPKAVYNHREKAMEFEMECGHSAFWPVHSAATIESMGKLSSRWPNLDEHGSFCVGWEIAAWIAKKFTGEDVTVFARHQVDPHREIFNRALVALYEARV